MPAYRPFVFLESMWPRAPVVTPCVQVAGSSRPGHSNERFARIYLVGVDGCLGGRVAGLSIALGRCLCLRGDWRGIHLLVLSQGSKNI